MADAIEKAKSNLEGPTLIEVQINRDDCTNELITGGHYIVLANGRPPKKSHVSWNAECYGCSSKGLMAY